MKKANEKIKYGIDLRLTIITEWTPEEFDEFFSLEFLDDFIHNNGFICGGGCSATVDGYIIKVGMETGGSVLEAEVAMDLLSTWCDNKGLDFHLDFDIIDMNNPERKF